MQQLSNLLLYSSKTNTTKESRRENRSVVLSCNLSAASTAEISSRIKGDITWGKKKVAEGVVDGTYKKTIERIVIGAKGVPQKSFKVESGEMES